MEVLPRTNGPKRVGSYVTQTLIADSIIPSNFSDTYCFCRCSLPSSIEIERSRSRTNDSLTFWRIAVSLIRIKFHGCENPTEGAWWAAFSIRSRTSFGISRPSKWERTSLLENIALYRPSFSLPVRLSSGVIAVYWAEVPLLDLRCRLPWRCSCRPSPRFPCKGRCRRTCGQAKSRLCLSCPCRQTDQ